MRDDYRTEFGKRYADALTNYQHLHAALMQALGDTSVSIARFHAMSRALHAVVVTLKQLAQEQDNSAALNGKP